MSLMYKTILDTTELGFELRERLGRPGYAVVPLDDSDDDNEAYDLARDVGLSVLDDGTAVNAERWMSNRRWVVTASIQIAYNLCLVPAEDLYQTVRDVEGHLKDILGDLVGDGGLTSLDPNLLVDDYDIVVIPGIRS